MSHNRSPEQQFPGQGREAFGGATDVLTSRYYGEVVPAIPSLRAAVLAAGGQADGEAVVDGVVRNVAALRAAEQLQQVAPQAPISSETRGQVADLQQYRALQSANDAADAARAVAQTSQQRAA